MAGLQVLGFSCASERSERRCGPPLIRIRPGDQLSSKRYSYSPATLPQFVSQMSLLLAGPVRLRGISLADGRLSCGKKGRFSTDLTIFSTENRRNSRFKRKTVVFDPSAIRRLTEKGAGSTANCWTPSSNRKPLLRHESHLRSAIAGNSARALTSFRIHGFVVAESRTSED